MEQVVSFTVEIEGDPVKFYHYFHIKLEEFKLLLDILTEAKTSHDVFVSRKLCLMITLR